MKTTIFTMFAAAALAVEGYAGEKLTVVITDRQDNESTYSYFVPGRSMTTSRAGADCSTVSNSTNCSGTGTATTLTTPSVRGELTVSGATLSLQLPDGRTVVVNCASKTRVNVNDLAHRIPRNCKIPMTNTITAEFDGGNAKLIWPAGIDGKKTASETYKIVSIMEK